MGNQSEEKYVLYDKSSEPPNLEDITHFIPVPVSNVSITSTTHLGFIEAIDAAKKVKGAVGLNLYYSNRFKEMVKSGAIRSIGKSKIEHEQLIDLNPDLVFSYAIDASDLKEITNLRKFNQKIVIVPEYMEQDPLMKASWVKVFSLFLEESYQQKADSVFHEVSVNYNRIKEEAKSYKSKPSVMIGYPWKGTWYVSGGKSFQSRLIQDAHADYLWQNKLQVGGVPLSTEQVMNDALKADVWINCGSVQSFEDIASDQPSLVNFKAFKDRTIFQNYRRSISNGANDYWESGVVRPDLILNDLVSIFHKENYSGKELYFYSQLEP